MDILLYALVAVFLAWRLYGLLGTRSGQERQRPNPFELRPDAEPRKDAEKDKKEDLFALPLPPAARTAGADNRQDAEAPPLQAEPAPLSLAGGLHAIRKADPSFDEKEFLKGARAAFEMVVRAFASGDRAVLKNLLSSGLYTTFGRELDARETRGERQELRSFTLRDAELVSARLEGREAVVAVQFSSEQSRILFDKDGTVLHDPGRAVEQLTDVWSFRRTLASPDPNWKLVDTRSA